MLTGCRDSKTGTVKRTEAMFMAKVRFGSKAGVGSTSTRVMYSGVLSRRTLATTPKLRNETSTH
jgi:hypothetical protein